MFQIIDDDPRLALTYLVAGAETSEAALRLVLDAIARLGVPQ